VLVMLLLKAPVRNGTARGRAGVAAKQTLRYRTTVPKCGTGLYKLSRSKHGCGDRWGKRSSMNETRAVDGRRARTRSADVE
jgi:hypothetical protein